MKCQKSLRIGCFIGLLILCDILSATTQKVATSELALDRLYQSAVKLSNLRDCRISFEAADVRHLPDLCISNSFDVKGEALDVLTKMAADTGGYNVSLDKSVGCIDVYPTNSCLNWKPLNVEALTNRTVSQIFEEDLLDFRRHGVYFDSGRGNLSWLNTQITVTNCSTLSARSLLNQICAALPFKARWEVVGLPWKGVSVLRFCGCEDHFRIPVRPHPKPIDDSNN